MSFAKIKEELKNKFENGNFAGSDLPAFFDIFSYLGNEVEDIQEEAEDWDRTIGFNLEGQGSFWVKIEDCKFSNGAGANPEVDLQLTMTADNAVLIFIGEKDAEAALTSGELQVQGNLPDAIRFYEILELVLEEIEY